MTYYGIINQDIKIILGGLTAVIIGIPIAGFGSEIAVNGVFSPQDAKLINDSNWNLYKEGQFFTYTGIAMFVIGAAILNTADYRNEDQDENYGAEGLILVVLGSIATVVGLVQSEMSILKFTNSVIDTYKTKNRTYMNANIVLFNGSRGKLLPGFQAIIKF